MSAWTNDSFKKLPDSTKALFGYLCDVSNEFGCFHISVDQMASDMQKDKNEVRLSLSFLAKNGFALYDEEEEFVLLKEKMPKAATVDVLKCISSAFGDSRPAILSALAAEMKRMIAENKKKTDEAFAEAFGEKPKKYSQKEIKIKPETAKKKRAPSKKDDTAEKAFEEFWKVYPRKDGKDDAKSAFLKAAKTTDPSIIVEAAKVYKKQNLRTEQKYILLPRSFIFRKKYLDLPESAEPVESCDNKEVNELLLALEA